MRKLSPEKVFEDAEKGIFPALLRLQGDNPYLLRELKSLLQKIPVEVAELDLKKSGPKLEAEEMGSGISLFMSRRLLWLSNPAALSQWSKRDLEIWRRLLAQADGESFFIILHTSSDRRLKWDSLGLEDECSLDVPTERRPFWIKRMNQKRGAALKNAQLQFLSDFEEDFMLVDNWIELWSLGGDLWAEKTLGYKENGVRENNFLAANPAFAWVDAVIAGDAKEALKQLRRLEDDSHEALQLMGLLSKSVRILAALDLNLTTKGQPPFLVDKLKNRRARASALLRKCQEVDWRLKSSAVDKFTLLSTLY